jgi:glucose/arabinose dehydrogenase
MNGTNLTCSQRPNILVDTLILQQAMNSTRKLMKRKRTALIVTLGALVLAVPVNRYDALAQSAPTQARGSVTSNLRLTPHRITLVRRRPFNLNLPENFEIAVAAEGLKRVRFMASSPDNRIFVTDLYNLTDNHKGTVYILDDFDPVRLRFKKVIPYMTGLRNPNSVGFYTDPNGDNWFYLALTDRLLRYRYQEGSTKPTGEPEVLATFPDYGLSYKYGGWHLTRTIAVGRNGKIYVSVGSSCNACEEKEDVRASILEMDPDGKNQHHFARGLRNAVGLRWALGSLFATDMGADHLGKDRPADTMGIIREGANYGWPYCFQSGRKVYVDPKLNPDSKKMDCGKIQPASVAFAAHSSPLGLEYFGAGSVEELSGFFLVALHGSTTKSLNRGYKLVRVSPGTPTPPEDFITGFLNAGIVYGRPADVFSVGPDAFLLTDDRAGVVYYVYKK